MQPHLIHSQDSPVFPDGLAPLEDGLVALGGKLTPGVLLEAYRKGIFPWTGSHPIPWYSPDPRLILFPKDLHVSRSLKRRLRSRPFEIRYDTRYEDLMRLCAKHPRRGQDGSWITPNMQKAYGSLHRRGVAHSVEVHLEGRLVGGIYGLALGAAFFGESMVSVETNASKVALVHLCLRLERSGFAFLDCQQVTDHMLRMGAVPVSRAEYLARLEAAVALPDRW